MDKDESRTLLKNYAELYGSKVRTCDKCGDIFTLSKDSRVCSHCYFGTKEIAKDRLKH